ncbi:unnamed protein product [Aureobasidium mustum]|uniref:U6 snRNA phosphodiesterase n=1 Tax=Aureobasidium mustum TaxID=2773714 RepID=A0A9N8JI59_9PEZI|nr:unnamed protein product [Aureobasidium mustum]
MTLVAYSDSEEDDEPAAKRPKKDKDADHKDDDLPPLPAEFLNLYSSSVRVSNTDDPSLHHGRKRVVKHVEGNWPTHVYLECMLKFCKDLIQHSRTYTASAGLPSPAEHDTLNKLLKALPESSNVHSLLQTPLQVPLPLHISLSAPLVLRTGNKDAFLDTITEAVTPVVRSLRHPIAVRPASLSWHGNDDSSRYFLVLRVQDAEQTQETSALTLLNQLLKASNKVVQDFNQPQLYTKLKRQAGSSDFSPYFHISIGWSLPSPDRNLADDNLKLQPAVEPILKELCENMVVSFDAVKIRIGQTVTALPIGEQASAL